MTEEQANTMIELLTQIRDTTAANAIVVEAMHAEAIRPRLEVEHLRVQMAEHLSALEREQERLRVAEQLEKCKRPRLFANAASKPRLPEGEAGP